MQYWLLNFATTLQYVMTIFNKVDYIEIEPALMTVTCVFMQHEAFDWLCVSVTQSLDPGTCITV